MLIRVVRTSRYLVLLPIIGLAIASAVFGFSRRKRTRSHLMNEFTLVLTRSKSGGSMSFISLVVKSSPLKTNVAPPFAVSGLPVPDDWSAYRRMCQWMTLCMVSLSPRAVEAAVCAPLL